MPAVDYFVATVPEAGHNADLTFARLTGQVPAMHYRSTLYGAFGWRVGKTFVGAYNDNRLLISVTGDRANVVYPMLRSMAEADREQWSVARIDVQCTYTVPDADQMVIQAQPAGGYKAMRVQPLTGTGCTLYVGAPKSDRRLRVYNKSAEAGMYPDGGQEYLRVEVVLRNRRADQFFGGMHTMGDMYAYHVSAMLADCDLRDMIMADTAGIQFPLTDDGDEWISRRLRWVDACVIPALRKLDLATDLDMADYVRRGLHRKE